MTSNSPIRDALQALRERHGPSTELDVIEGAARKLATEHELARADADDLLDKLGDARNAASAHHEGREEALHDARELLRDVDRGLLDLPEAIERIGKLT